MAEYSFLKKWGAYLALTASVLTYAPNIAEGQVCRTNNNGEVICVGLENIVQSPACAFAGGCVQQPATSVSDEQFIPPSDYQQSVLPYSTSLQTPISTPRVR
ncbi:MAG: hypothetical protein WCV90_00785 [Candidatus Woesearchaeota archaeon]